MHTFVTTCQPRLPVDQILTHASHHASGVGRLCIMWAMPQEQSIPASSRVVLTIFFSFSSVWARNQFSTHTPFLCALLCAGLPCVHPCIAAYLGITVMTLLVHQPHDNAAHPPCSAICSLQGFYVFIRALQLLRAHNQGVVLVGLGGASGSGKTAFSAKVRAEVHTARFSEVLTTCISRVVLCSKVRLGCSKQQNCVAVWTQQQQRVISAGGRGSAVLESMASQTVLRGASGSRPGCNLTCCCALLGVVAAQCN